MVRNVAPEMAELEPEDFYLLSGVEQGMRFSEWVQKEKIPSFSRLTAEEVEYRIDRCLDRELLQRKTIQYEGYTLTFEGYDALALRAFSERDTIQGVGSPLGVGKESDVYEVQSFRPLALKYHREGYTNFREVMKERDYTSDREHVSWLYTARKAAEREYNILEALYPDVSVPRPIDHNRHAIVMEKIDGVELARSKFEDEQVVPADMSEYNVFVNSEGITIFDWPQSIPTDHQNAAEFLERDVRNIVGYFERKYPRLVTDVDVPEVARAITENEFESVSNHVDDGP
jgi:RIO kinase 2